MDRDYLYEVHKSGCAHLKFQKMNVWETDRYETPEELIEADMVDIQQIGGVNERQNYRIMPCLDKKVVTKQNKHGKYKRD